MKRIPQGRYSKEFREESVKLVIDQELGIGCKPEPQRIPSTPFQPSHDRIKINDLPVITEGIVPIQVDGAMPPVKSF